MKASVLRGHQITVDTSEELPDLNATDLTPSSCLDRACPGQNTDCSVFSAQPLHRPKLLSGGLSMRHYQGENVSVNYTSLPPQLEPRTLGTAPLCEIS